MVGETILYKLEDVLTEKQVHQLVKRYVSEDQWEIVDSMIKPATEGLAGFLGDHLKATLQVRAEGLLKTINLFIKRIPPGNQPKADFINQNNYYKREMAMFQLFEEMSPDEDPNPWCTKALACNESTLVLRDLNADGYSPRSSKEVFDLAHVLVATASLARFHAAFANYETKKIAHSKPYNFLKEYEPIMTEATFRASPWMRASAKLTASLLDTFSSKFTRKIPDLEENLYAKYVEACDSLKEYEDTLNVVIHKDLWAHNIMFRYENGLPGNAILIDFQCVRYGPPAFDVMGMLYLTTTRSFREHHERKVLHYYYCVFFDSLETATKERLNGFGFDRENFLRWCERSRKFGICLAIGIFPYGLMDPLIGQKTFDDPETYDKLLVEDRSGPVVAHARECTFYRERQLETAEEFVERFILNNHP